MKVMIFRSTRDVIMTEKTCRNEGIKCRVIPVPRSVSPLCGMALELDDNSAAEALAVVERLGIETDIFDRTKVKL